MPTAIEPMKAVTGELPDDDDGWAFEVKWDGMRSPRSATGGAAAAEVEPARRHRPVPRARPDWPLRCRPTRWCSTVRSWPCRHEGRPDFGRLQRRMQASEHRSDRRGTAAATTSYRRVRPALARRSSTSCRCPMLDRRRLLTELVEPGPRWQVPAHQVGDGAALLTAVIERRLEGVMAKRIDSPYEPGRRSRSWRKVKVRRRQELVVGGWLPGTGGRASTFGALLVGYHEAGRLRYAGRVGTGFDAVRPRRAADRPHQPDPPDLPVRSPALRRPRPAWPPGPSPTSWSRSSSASGRPTASCGTPPTWVVASTRTPPRSSASRSELRGSRAGPDH